MTRQKKAPMAPMTTPQLVELAKRKLAVQLPAELRNQPMSDYRLAKLLKVRQQTVSNWQNGRTRIGREFVTRFAEVTDLPEVYVFACVELEREKDPGLRGVLHALALQFASEAARRAATMILGLGLGLLGTGPAPSQAATGGPVAGPGLYIMANRRRRGPELTPA